MRIRDVLMVVIALGALLFGWSQEGSISFRRGFMIPLADSDVLVHHYARPLVVDWRRDRKPVLIACPRPDILAVYPTHHARRNYEDVFVHMSPLRQVQVYSTIVGIGAGNLTRGFQHHPSFVPTPASTSPTADSLIVIVTDDYRLEAFDPSLRSVWVTSIIPLEQAGIVLHHAAITILTERIYEQDKGTIVVALRVSGNNGTEHMLVSAFAGDSGELRWRHVADDYHTGASAAGPQAATSTTSGNGLNATEAAVEQLLMGTDTLTERSSDLHWTHFREAIVGALPHSYSHAWDTVVVPHVMFHKKNRKKHRHAAQKDPSLKYKDRNVALKGHDVGTLGETLGAERALSGRSRDPHHPSPIHSNTVVVHTKDGLDVLHLYTGKRVTRVHPLKPNTVYHDMDDDFHVDAISTKFGTRMDVHHRHGVDLVFDCLGAIHSGAPVAADPVYNATICDSEGFFSGLSLVSHFIRHPSDTDDDGEEGGGSGKRVADALSLIGSRNIGHEKTRGVTPVVVQHLQRKGRDLFKAQRRAVFLIDTGLVTCLDPSGKQVLWRLQTDASFTDTAGDIAADEQEVSMGLHSEEEKEARVRRFPHLVRYAVHQHRNDLRARSASQRYHETDPFVIAVGHQALSVINARSGALASSVTLTSPPVGPTLVADFNGDGVNDILVFSANAIYGFVAHQQASSSVVTMLILVMVSVLGALVVARELRSREYEEEAAESLPTSMRHGGVVPGTSGTSTFPAARRVKRSTD